MVVAAVVEDVTVIAVVDADASRFSVPVAVDALTVASLVPDAVIV
jgi:hypothetical protein